MAEYIKKKDIRIGGGKCIQKEEAISITVF
jgi:hypothetical protein